MDPISMKLLGYSVEKMSFVLNKSFKAVPNEKVKMSPKFNREVTRLSDQRFTVTLSFSFEELETEIPFYLDIQISGIFEAERLDDQVTFDFVKKSATAILYPYMRALITTLTATGNVPPYVLPVINPEAVFKDK